MLTARKRVGPLPAPRLAWRRASPRSSDHHPSSSSLSSDSLPVNSSGLDAPDQAHSGSSTRDVSPRLGYPSRRALRHSKAFHRWCAAPLSTLYPPTTSESSSGDSSERPLHSSSHSAGPSRKRCRSPVDFVPSSTPVMGSLAPTRADLLPPRKRFRDSYSSEASIEEDTEVNPIETEVEMELGIGDGDDVRDHVEIDPRDVRDDTEEYEADTSAGDTVEVGINLMSTPIVEEEIVEPAGEDSSDCSCDGLEADQLIARGQRTGMIKRIKSLRLENLKVHAILDIERDRVNSLRLHMSLLLEEFHQVRRDHDDTQGRLRRLESLRLEEPQGCAMLDIERDRVNSLRLHMSFSQEEFLSGSSRGCRVNEILNSGMGKRRQWRRFGNGDLVWNNDNGIGTGNGYSQWKQRRRTAVTGIALTWWNSHKRTTRTNAAYALSWRELLRKLDDWVYCQDMRSKKMETRVMEFIGEEQ
ncbi:hypothetical protein Tco_0902723 [Tanacetum coccineum]